MDNSVKALDTSLEHRPLIAQLVALSNARSYLEVGVREGDTTRAALLHGTVQDLLLCDTWGPHHGGTNRGSNAHIRAMLRELGFQGVTQFWDGPSSTLWKSLDYSQTYDIVHIDGDHSEVGAYTDMIEGWRHANLMMVVHDANFPSVAKAIETFMREANSYLAHPRPTMHKFEGDQGTAVFVRQS